MRNDYEKIKSLMLDVLDIFHEHVRNHGLHHDDYDDARLLLVNRLAMWALYIMQGAYYPEHAQQRILNGYSALRVKRRKGNDHAKV